MKIFIFTYIFVCIFVLKSFAFYSETVSRNDFQELFNQKGEFTSSLKYDADKSAGSGFRKYFSGSGNISGVLVYHYYLEDISIPGKWRLIFYPDKQERIILTDGYGFDAITLLKNINNPAESMSGILSDNINITDEEFKKIFGDKYGKEDRYIIGGIAVRAELDIHNLQLVDELGYASKFDISYIKTAGKIKNGI